MNNSLKVRLEFYVCHSAIIYYERNSTFNSFDSFCSYVNTFITNKYYNTNLPQYIKKVIFYIAEKVNRIFGISDSEMLEVVLNFFSEKLWVEYKPLVFPVKDMYESSL